MGLHWPLTGGSVSQHFGPSTMAIQPSMWVVRRDYAWWQPIAGGVFNYNVHAGTDFAGRVAGTPLLALEAGTVVRSTYDGDNGGGHVVEVEIRPGTRYSYNHCQSRLVGVGAKVKKGQAIATVGATGTILQSNGTRVRSAYGVHLHCVLTIVAGGIPMLYNAYQFLDGQPRAGDPRIRPLAPTYKIVHIRPGVNIRATPDLDVGAANILYVTRTDGIYTVRTGARAASLSSGFQLRREFTNDDGTWGELFGFNRLVYVMKGLYY